MAVCMQRRRWCARAPRPARPLCPQLRACGAAAPVPLTWPRSRRAAAPVIGPAAAPIAGRPQRGAIIDRIVVGLVAGCITAVRPGRAGVRPRTPAALGLTGTKGRGLLLNVMTIGRRDAGGRSRRRRRQRLRRRRRRRLAVQGRESLREASPSVTHCLSRRGPGSARGRCWLPGAGPARPAGTRAREDRAVPRGACLQAGRRRGRRVRRAPAAGGPLRRAGEQAEQPRLLLGRQLARDRRVARLQRARQAALARRPVVRRARLLLRLRVGASKSCAHAGTWQHQARRPPGSAEQRRLAVRGSSMQSKRPDAGTGHQCTKPQAMREAPPSACCGAAKSKACHRPGGTLARKK